MARTHVIEVVVEEKHAVGSDIPEGIEIPFFHLRDATELVILIFVRHITVFVHHRHDAAANIRNIIGRSSVSRDTSLQTGAM